MYNTMSCCCIMRALPQLVIYGLGTSCMNESGHGLPRTYIMIKFKALLFFCHPYLIFHQKCRI